MQAVGTDNDDSHCFSAQVTSVETDIAAIFLMYIINLFHLIEWKYTGDDYTFSNPLRVFHFFLSMK